MYLVIDVGGTYTKYGYYHKDGTCHTKNQFPTIKTNKEDFYQKLISLVHDNIQGIAVSMPGLINNQTGYIEAITLLPFLANQSVIEELHQYVHVPITIENDAKCATLGEMWKGSLKNVKNGLMIVIGSGIGGTIIIDGNILNSPHHKAGEIGSLLIPLDSHYQKMTNFGRHNNANSLITSLSKCLNCKNDGEIVFGMLSQNPQAMNLFKQYCREIALMIYNLDYILDLDIVSLGGGISEQPLLISTIQDEFHDLRNQYQEDHHQPIIVGSQFQNEANLLGALYHHLKNYDVSHHNF